MVPASLNYLNNKTQERAIKRKQNQNRSAYDIRLLQEADLKDIRLA